MVFQDPRAHVNPVRTIGDFMTEALRIARHRARRDAAARRGRARCARRRHRPTARGACEQYPHELSGGLLQRVMIATVLLARAPAVLADEPTTALDVTTQAEVMAILDELRRERGLALLFITHDLELAAAVCDRTCGHVRRPDRRDGAASPARTRAAAIPTPPRSPRARPDVARDRAPAAGDPRPAGVGVRGPATAARSRRAAPTRRTPAARRGRRSSTLGGGEVRCRRAARAARAPGRGDRDPSEATRA